MVFFACPKTQESIALNYYVVVSAAGGWLRGGGARSGKRGPPRARAPQQPILIAQGRTNDKSDMLDVKLSSFGFWEN